MIKEVTVEEEMMVITFLIVVIMVEIVTMMTKVTLVPLKKSLPCTEIIHLLHLRLWYYLS